MTKSILLAAVLALSATAASAGTVKLPEEYQGSWCITDVTSYKGGTHIRHESCNTPDTSERTFVGPTSLFSYTLGECNHLLKKSKLAPPNDVGNRVLTLTYQCKGGKLTAEMWIDRAALFIDAKIGGK